MENFDSKIEIAFTSEVVNIPYGDKGTAKTIEAMQKFADNACFDFEFIQLARKIVSSVPDRDKTQQADAIFLYVKDNIRFINDPVIAEMVQTPKITLEIGWGDCDDFATLIAALNQAIGNHVGFVTISLPGEREFSHVFVALLDGPDAPRYYDAVVHESYPGWYPPEFNRARLWITKDDYQDLSGLFSFVKKLFKKIGNIFKKIYKELKRFERHVRKERNRLFVRISKEFSRWENKMGVFGKFLVLGTKVAAGVVTGGIMPVFGSGMGLGIGSSSLSTTIVNQFWAGQAINAVTNEISSKETPWTMNEEEWRMLLNLATTIGSTILSFVPGTQAILASSIISLMEAGSTVWDLEERKKQSEEILEKIKEQQARLAFEARIQREAIGKLEKDILLLEKALNWQKESEMRMSNAKQEIEAKIDLIWNSAIKETQEYFDKYFVEIEVNKETTKHDIQQSLLNELNPFLPLLPVQAKTEISNIIASITI